MAQALLMIDVIPVPAVAYDDEKEIRDVKDRLILRAAIKAGVYPSYWRQGFHRKHDNESQDNDSGGVCPSVKTFGNCCEKSPLGLPCGDWLLVNQCGKHQQAAPLFISKCKIAQRQRLLKDSGSCEANRFLSLYWIVSESILCLWLTRSITRKSFVVPS
jgi:hypothetical protein